MKYTKETNISVINIYLNSDYSEASLLLFRWTIYWCRANGNKSNGFKIPDSSKQYSMFRQREQSKLYSLCRRNRCNIASLNPTPSGVINQIPSSSPIFSESRDCWRCHFPLPHPRLLFDDSLTEQIFSRTYTKEMATTGGASYFLWWSSVLS